MYSDIVFKSKLIKKRYYAEQGGTKIMRNNPHSPLLQALEKILNELSFEKMPLLREALKRSQPPEKSFEIAFHLFREGFMAKYPAIKKAVENSFLPDSDQVEQYQHVQEHDDNQFETLFLKHTSGKDETKRQNKVQSLSISKFNESAVTVSGDEKRYSSNEDEDNHDDLFLYDMPNLNFELNLDAVISNLENWSLSKEENQQLKNDVDQKDRDSQKRVDPILAEKTIRARLAYERFARIRLKHFETTYRQFYGQFLSLGNYSVESKRLNKRSIDDFFKDFLIRILRFEAYIKQGDEHQAWHKQVTALKTIAEHMYRPIVNLENISKKQVDLEIRADFEIRKAVKAMMNFGDDNAENNRVRKLHFMQIIHDFLPYFVNPIELFNETEDLQKLDKLGSHCPQLSAVCREAAEVIQKSDPKSKLAAIKDEENQASNILSNIRTSKVENANESLVKNYFTLRSQHYEIDPKNFFQISRYFDELRDNLLNSNDAEAQRKKIQVLETALRALQLLCELKEIYQRICQKNNIENKPKKYLKEIIEATSKELHTALRKQAQQDITTMTVELIPMLEQYTENLNKVFPKNEENLQVISGAAFFPSYYKRIRTLSRCDVTMSLLGSTMRLVGYSALGVITTGFVCALLLLAAALLGSVVAGPVGSVCGALFAAKVLPYFVLSFTGFGFCGGAVHSVKRSHVMMERTLFANPHENCRLESMQRFAVAYQSFLRR